ncbi:hypothetical protein NP493_503g01018 [Ridgeia piscesae]|uniref:Uncharacterized protein n=1 Tax=Ridgeia piscesae TaxID=27915 RepID=A0AAD9KXI7_RIDPI|nr:hypothetical protein NP493_503g01018 [Ridgeia piscesae]
MYDTRTHGSLVQCDIVIVALSMCMACPLEFRRQLQHDHRLTGRCGVDLPGPEHSDSRGMDCETAGTLLAPHIAGAPLCCWTDALQLAAGNHRSRSRVNCST